MDGSKKGPPPHNLWILYTDGASNKEGYGAGLMLKGPEGDEITHTLCFKFNTSNNESEYKVLLAEMRLAKEIGAQHVKGLSDSLLITNQVNGIYEVKYQRMQ